MIRLYFVRHGIAVDHGEDRTIDDGSRPLTQKGRRRFRKTAQRFARLAEPIDTLFTSPLVRAAQTAELLAGALRCDEVGVLEELRPEVSARKLLETVARRVKDGQGVALVGHDPQMTELVASLGGVPAQRVEFRKGAIVRIDVGGLPSGKPAEARYWLRREKHRGLPLKPEEPAAGGPAKKT